MVLLVMNAVNLITVLNSFVNFRSTLTHPKNKLCCIIGNNATGYKITLIMISQTIDENKECMKVDQIHKPANPRPSK